MGLSLSLQSRTDSRSDFEAFTVAITALVRGPQSRHHRLARSSLLSGSVQRRGCCCLTRRTARAFDSARRAASNCGAAMLAAPRAQPLQRDASEASGFALQRRTRDSPRAAKRRPRGGAREKLRHEDTAASARRDTRSGGTPDARFSRQTACEAQRNHFCRARAVDADLLAAASVFLIRRWR
jgi:hypothetical protein